MIKKADSKDAGLLAGLAIQMWKEHSLADLADEFKEIIKKDDSVCFITYVDDKPVAFAQCQLRHDYVNGGIQKNN